MPGERTVRVEVYPQGTTESSRRRKGASDQEIMEAVWVAAEMRAGGAYAHSTIALHTLGVQEHAEGR